MLEEAFPVEEIVVALHRIEPSKVLLLGQDGMPASFYKKYWDIFGDDVIMACLGFFNGDESLAVINKTMIALIPKIQNPMMPKDFPPISLCNVIYKLVLKVFANQMKMVLLSLISKTQSAFISDRMVFDNAMVAFETTHSMKNKRFGNIGQIDIKTDMAKAYD